MSLDRKAPQAYAPLRLKQSQIEPFFNSVRDRKVTRGTQPESLKVVTSKPFEKTAAAYEKVENKKKRKSTKKAKSSSSPPKKRQKKKVIEKTLRNVNI